MNKPGGATAKVSGEFDHQLATDGIQPSVGNRLCYLLRAVISFSDTADAHAWFLADPDAWATVMEPVLVPEACREMLYKYQVGVGD